MRERLSSSMTFIYRVAFPAVWIAMFGAGTVMILLGGIDAPVFVKVGYALAWIGGSAFLLLFTRRFRTVWLEGDRLVVAEPGGSMEIPLADVVEVRETRMTNPKLIRVKLSPHRDWPERVEFMAPVTFQLPFTDHPVVTRLRQRVREARSREQPTR